MIELRMTTTDGTNKVRKYPTLPKARAFVRRQLGCFDIGTGYLIGEYGDCKITVKSGCTFADPARDRVPPSTIADRFRVYVCTPRRGGRDEILGKHSELRGTVATWKEAISLHDRLQARANDEESVEIRQVAKYPASYGNLTGSWGFETECFADPNATMSSVELTDSEIPF